MFTTPEMAAIFSAEAHVRMMLVFEAALAHAEARAGVIAGEAADAIVAGCRVELYDVGELYREAGTAGTVAIPLVRALRSKVEEAGRDYVHWGATSQDAIDCALMLQMREGLDLLIEGLLGTCEACARLAEEHRGTLMPGRTLLQQAVPITFGLKAARWLGMLTRRVDALRECKSKSLAVQFGGAAGTLAVLGGAGTSVAESLADELDLPMPDLPWHGERDRVAAIAGAMAVTAGAVAKIAGDIVLLAQTEVGEVSEEAAPGKGGSSAMPQKRNPVDATLAIASSRLAVGAAQVVLAGMQQEHERAAGGWQTEWQAIPDLFCYTAAAVDHVSKALGGLKVDVERMEANIWLGSGLLMSEALLVALTPKLGRLEAQRVVEEVGKRASEQGVSLREVAGADERVKSALSPEGLSRALDPDSYLGSTGTFIDRALVSYRATRARG